MDMGKDGEMDKAWAGGKMDIYIDDETAPTRLNSVALLLPLTEPIHRLAPRHWLQAHP